MDSHLPIKVNILGVPIDKLSMDETVSIIANTIRDNNSIHQTAVNAFILSMIGTDTALRKSIINSDLINADGQSVVWASKFLGNPLPERVTGIDLMERLIKLSFQENYKIFFLGAKEEVVKKVVKVYSEKYSNRIIAGYRNGYFKKEEEADVAAEIAQSGANMLFVAMNSPKKEIFLFENKSTLKKVNFIMGVGGSFDVVAGKVKRAPGWMQKFGLEWFFRFLQEPKRMMKRYTVGSGKFIVLIIKQRLGYYR